MKTSILAGTALALALTACGKKADAPPPSESVAPASPAAPVPTEPGAGAPSALPSEAPAAPAAVVIAPGTPVPIADLAKAVVGIATDPAGRARNVVDGIRARVGRLPSDRPLGRDVMSTVAAATAALASTPESRPPLTGIECGALTRSVLEALSITVPSVIVYEPSAGKTALRRRDIGFISALPGYTGVVAPGRLAEPIEGAETVPLTPDGEMGLMLGLAALRLAEERKLDEALTRLGEAEKLRQGDAALGFLRGQLLSIRGKTDDGLEAMEHAVAEAEDADGRYQLAVAYLQAEEQFSAYKALKRAIELDAHHIRALSALANVELDRRQGAPEPEQQLIDVGLDAIEKGLEAAGKDVEGLAELRVQRLRLAGKADEAEKLAIDVLNRQPKRASLHLALADIAVGKGQTEVAERHFEKAAEADPEDAQALVRLAALRAERGDIDKTIEAFQEATRRAPHDSELLASYAGLLLQAGRTDEATKTANDLKDRFPEVAEGYAILAQISFQAGNTDGANTLLEQAVVKNPKAADLYTMLYMGYTMVANVEAATKTLERLLKVDPDGRMKIAQTLLQTGQVEGAAALLQKEIEARPDRVEVAITLGQIYRLGKRTDDEKKMRKLVEDKGDANLLKAFDDALIEVEKQAADAPAPEGDPGE